MAESDKTQIQQLHNHTKKPLIPLRIYHRRIRPKSVHDLPEELVFEILKRLPVTSLLRFMRVSKSWHSLITNPSFISAHLSHQSLKNRITTLYSVDSNYFLHNLDDPLDDWCKIDSPLGNLSMTVVGCCDGVICLYGDWCRAFDPLILWNPSIRKAFKLPLPMPNSSFRGRDEASRLLNFSLGFGFDSISRDYKVVRVFHKWDMKKNATYFHADVCSLSQGDWRTVGIRVEGQGETFFIERRGVHVSGVIHWMCKKKLNDNVFVKTTLAFNLGDEDFCQVLPPNPLSSSVLFSIKFDEYKLAVSCCGDDGSNVWVMEEYSDENSWRKLLTCHLADNIGPILGAFVGGDGKIVVTTSVGNWISWDPSNQILKNLALPLLEPDYVDTYVQTLVLLNFKNPALHCRELPLRKKVDKTLTEH